jgi:hypothetical protein
VHSDQRTRGTRNIKLLALPFFGIALSLVLLAGGSSGTRDAEAVGPGIGMDLECPASAGVGVSFNCTIATGASPPVAIAGWGNEILVPLGVSVDSTASGNNLPQCTTEIGGRTQGGGAGPPDLCLRQTGLAAGPTFVRHVIVSSTQGPPPLAAMDGITPNAAGDVLVTVGFTCTSLGPKTMVMTYVGAPPKDSPFGGFYGDTNANVITIKSGDNESVTCVPPPVGGVVSFPDGESSVASVEASAPSAADNGLPIEAMAASLAGLIAVVSAGWYARRRWVRS